MKFHRLEVHNLQTFWCWKRRRNRRRSCAGYAYKVTVKCTNISRNFYQFLYGRVST